LACSSEERRLRQAYVQALEHGDQSAMEDVQTAALDSYDPQKAAILFQRMALFETRFVPTLAGSRFGSTLCFPNRDRQGVGALFTFAG
jgi:hypothetical protein